MAAVTPRPRSASAGSPVDARRAPALRLLGPVEVSGPGGPVEMGSARHRELLAALAVDAGRVVGADTVLERVWGERDRGGTIANLQAAVSRLRTRLRGRTDLQIATVAPGYRLHVPPGGTDVDHFLADVAASQDARAAGDPHRARALLLAALDWWRGDALADVQQPFARAEALRLDGLRLSAEEQAAELDLELGDGEQAVERLRRLVAVHLLREDLRAQLMRALYASGRQADALAEYASLRETLAEELGIDPSPAVQRLHQQILEQDGALAVPAAASARPVAESRSERVASRVSLPSTDLLGELVGRERDVERLVAVLRSSTARLVTLTGVGGAGKSRLALAAASAAADNFADGVVYVPLAPLTDARAVLPAIAQAVGAPEAADPVGTLVQLLRDRHQLLLLDNAEHLLEAWADVADLVAACPGLRVLVTSRTPLRVRGEALIAVEPLDEEAAAELFAARAAAGQPIGPIDPDDPSVRALVRRLAGIPLALELAAARSRLLTPAAMLRRFDDLLAAEGARDLPRRQRTMQSTLDWSFELLAEPSRACFTRLAVFSDGFCLDAAVAVLADLVPADQVFGVLDSLVEQSLVVAESHDGAELPRFRLLEPVAQYAATRLDPVAETAARNAHLRFYGGLAERTEPSFRGPGTMAALAMVEREHANFAGAIEWGVRSGQVDAAGWLCWWLWLYWWLRGTLHEGQRLISLVLDADPRPGDTVRTRALAVRGAMAYARGDLAAASAFADCAELARANGDAEAEAHGTAGRGLLALAVEDLVGAVAEWRQAIDLTESIGLRGEWLWTMTHVWIGTTQLLRGDLEAAEAAVEQGLAAARRRSDPLGTYVGLFTAVQIALARGDHDRARQEAEEGLRLSRQTGDRANLAYFLEALALVDAADGSPGRVGVLMGAASALREQVGSRVYGYYRPDEAQIAAVEATARAERGGVSYAADLARGRAMTADAIVAFAVRKGPSAREP